MTAVVPHLRLSWGGTLGAPAAEVWTNSLKWANDQSETPTRDSLVAAAAAAAVPLKTWFGSSDATISPSAKLTWVKLNYIQADGKQRDQETVQFDVTPAKAGGFSAKSALWIQSYAITLRTGLTRGRGHAGRIYPPAVGDPQWFDGDTGYLSALAAGGMALAFGTAIRDIRNAINGVILPVQNAYDAVVISASKTGDARPPQSNEIVSVVCDRVPDIQHRRSNRLPRSESTTYVIADIP